MKKGPTLSISEALQERRISALGSSEDVGRAVQGIERLLRERHFAPGDRLVESDLAKALDLGRGPIREALRILAGDGVVELSANRGARIRIIDKTTLMEIMQVITSLFCLGADLLAARRPSERAIHALQAITQEIKSAAKRGDAHVLNLRFIEYHQIVFHFSGNKYLSQMFQRLHIAHYQGHVELALEGRVLKEIAQAYDAITAALEAGDATTAKAILCKQMAQIIAYMESSSEPIDRAVDSLVQKMTSESALIKLSLGTVRPAQRRRPKKRVRATSAAS
ncbi:MAG: GntR family transcriptional regulator [Steroidobacteraceae bacterium]